MPRSAKIVPIDASASEASAPEAAVPVAGAPEGAAVLVPLADLYLSPLNPRQEHDPEGIAALAESLVSIGLIQNLAGYRDPEGRVGVVAGGRRLAALALAAERRPDLDPVPVLLAPDEATARLWALAENTARAGLHIADEVRAYRRMAESGAGLPTIAAAFAVTEAHVRRRLKLAHLPEPVLDALKAGRIGAGHAQVLTLCADEERQLAALEMAQQRGFSEASLRRVLLEEAVPTHDRRVRFVGLDAYEAAGGTLTRDLFSEGEDAYLDSPALLERLFADKLAAAAAAERAEGWRWVEPYAEPYLPWDLGRQMGRVYPLPDDLSPEDEEELHTLHDLAEADELTEEGHARLDELENARGATYPPEHRAVAGGWLYVDREGELCEALGFVRPEDRQEAVAAGAIEAPRSAPASGAADGEDAPGKGPYSAALADDMRTIRLAAAQGALMDRPDLVLDLLAFCLTPESGWGAKVLAVRPEAQRVVPPERDGFVPDPRLTDEPTGYGDAPDLLDAFAAFQARGQEHRDATLARGLARALRYVAGPNDRARALFEHVEREAGANLRAVWRPTAVNLFGRMTSGALDDLAKGLLDRTDADPSIREFKAKKKGEKAHAMERLFSDPAYQDSWLITPEQRARIDAWVPPCA